MFYGGFFYKSRDYIVNKELRQVLKTDKPVFPIKPVHKSENNHFLSAGAHTGAPLQMILYISLNIVGADPCVRPLTANVRPYIFKQFLKMRT